METVATTRTASDFKLELDRLLGNNLYGLAFSESTYYVFIKPKTPKNSMDNIPSEFNGHLVKIVKSVPFLTLIT